MTKTVNPTIARKSLFQLLKDVNTTSTAVHIVGQNDENNAFLVGESDWQAIQETLYLYQTGEAQRVTEDELTNDNSSSIDITGGINWDTV